MHDPWISSILGACHRFALALNLSPKGGRKTLTVLLPFAHDWEKGLGDEGNAGFSNMTCSLYLCVWIGVCPLPHCALCISALSVTTMPTERDRQSWSKLLTAKLAMGMNAVWGDRMGERSQFSR